MAAPSVTRCTLEKRTWSVSARHAALIGLTRRCVGTVHFAFYVVHRARCASKKCRYTLMSCKRQGRSVAELQNNDFSLIICTEVVAVGATRA